MPFLLILTLFTCGGFFIYASGYFLFTSFPSYLQPIPDSLHTLSEFMNRMELALSQNGGDNFTILV